MRQYTEHAITAKVCTEKKLTLSLSHLFLFLRIFASKYSFISESAFHFGRWTWVSISRKKNVWIQKELCHMRLTLPGTCFLQNLALFLFSFQMPSIEVGFAVHYHLVFI